MNADAQVISLLRNQVAGIVLGSSFLLVGIGALLTAALRQRRQFGLLAWFGAFSSLYGLRMLAQAPAAFALLPPSAWPYRGYVVVIITYVIVLPALFFWLNLTKGKLRRFIQVVIVAAAVVAIVAIVAAVAYRKPDALMSANNAIAILFVLIVAVVNGIPSLSRRWMIEPSRILSAGALVLAAAVLANNLYRFLPMPDLSGLEPLAFGVFVFSLGYVTAQRVFSAERRLLSIESELNIARDIQQSILPTAVPQLHQLRVAASYLPMTSVAGDFYEFVDLDEKHAGFLVADVSGHGVPAALIASMIKVAMHSVAAQAAAPGEVMRGLNRILSQSLRSQFVTAAYLYIDLERRRASYSAAGHPPLLYWNASNKKLDKLESNGLLFGVLRDTEYPAIDLQLHPGDRLLLYTDGLIEAENTTGEAFGDMRLEKVIAENPDKPAAELTALLLQELGQWQAQAGRQQDDVTLIAIDLL